MSEEFDVGGLKAAGGGVAAGYLTAGLQVGSQRNPRCDGHVGGAEQDTLIRTENLARYRVVLEVTVTTRSDTHVVATGARPDHGGDRRAGHRGGRLRDEGVR